MTITPGEPGNDLPGKPPIVNLATWQAAREELLVREKAHTREGDAIAAARRRLPMVEFDGTVEVTGAEGPVPFHLRDDCPGQRSRQRFLRSARHDGLRPTRDVGGQPRGLARGSAKRMVLALGRRRHADVGSDESTGAAVDSPWGNSPVALRLRSCRI